MKLANTYKGYIDYQSEFDHRFACWASNHRGWAKMKKYNKKLAKRRMKQENRAFVKEYIIPPGKRRGIFHL